MKKDNTRKCEICGKKYVAKQPVQKYCSKTCKRAAEKKAKDAKKVVKPVEKKPAKVEAKKPVTKAIVAQKITLPKKDLKKISPKPANLTHFVKPGDMITFQNFKREAVMSYAISLFFSALLSK